MRKPIKLRTLTTKEVTAIKQLASSRKEPIRLAQRARVIVFMYEDSDLHATEAGFKVGFKSSAMGAEGVRRFNKKGLPGLEYQLRAGRQPIHKSEVRSTLTTLATQKSRMLGHPHEL